MSEPGTTRRIEVFRPGTFTPMQGAPITMTADDLRAIAAGYDPAGSPAPLVVGHPRTEDQAYGWATSFSYDEARGRLVAECGEIPTEFSEAVQAGRWKRISLSLFSPSAPNNPKPGSWYPKHIGFLGAAAPAVPGLAPVAFAGDAGAVVFEFGDDDDPADDAGVGRALRTLLTARRRAAREPGAARDARAWPVGWVDPAPAFAAPPAPPSPPPLPEPPVTISSQPTPPAPDAAAAARAAELDRREQEINRRAAEQAHTDNLAFAESLITEGKLLPASGDRVVSLLDSLVAAAPAEVSFSEGDGTKTLPAAQVVREILSAQPVVVSFGEMPRGRGDQAAGAVDFAAPDSRSVDRGGLEQLAKVRAHQAKNPNVSFADAVKAVVGRG